LDTYQIIFFDRDRKRAETVRDKILNLGWSKSFLDIIIFDHLDELYFKKQKTNTPYLFVFTDQELFFDQSKSFYALFVSTKTFLTLSHFKFDKEIKVADRRITRYTSKLLDYNKADFKRVINSLHFYVAEKAGKLYVKIYLFVTLFVAIITYILSMINPLYAAIFFGLIVFYIIGLRLYKIYLLNFTKVDREYCRCI